MKKPQLTLVFLAKFNVSPDKTPKILVDEQAK
jgi:hypothetical protein